MREAVVDPELIAAMRARREAERASDVDALDRYITDDYTMTNALGEIIHSARLPSEERIKRLRAIAAADVVIHEEHIRSYDGAAIRIARLSFNGDPVSLITVWVKVDGKWRAAATQVTPYRPPER